LQRLGPPAWRPPPSGTSRRPSPTLPRRNANRPPLRKIRSEKGGVFSYPTETWPPRKRFPPGWLGPDLTWRGIRTALRRRFLRPSGGPGSRRFFRPRERPPGRSPPISFWRGIDIREERRRRLLRDHPRISGRGRVPHAIFGVSRPTKCSKWP